MYCAHCRNPCGVRAIDEGIGWYEYWGHRACQTIMVLVSDCCEEGIVDENGVEMNDDDIRSYFDE